MQHEERLSGVHPDIVKVVRQVDANHPNTFVVLEGVRTLSRQKELFKKGSTKTMNSRHLTGHAVDLGVLIDGTLVWDWSSYANASKYVKEAAKQVGVSLEWGGDWTKFRDGPHWQIPWGDT